MEEMGNQESSCPLSQKRFFWNHCPGLLHAITSNADSPEDADLLLLGSLTVFSACMPNVYGVYGQHEVFPNLFLFVTAKAQQGKEDFPFVGDWLSLFTK